jgi:hypothetical protein
LSEAPPENRRKNKREAGLGEAKVIEVVTVIFSGDTLGNLNRHQIAVEAALKNCTPASNLSGFWSWPSPRFSVLDGPRPYYPMPQVSRLPVVPARRARHRTAKVKVGNVELQKSNFRVPFLNISPRQGRRTGVGRLLLLVIEV